MRMKWPWTVCLEKGGEWFRGKEGLELSGRRCPVGQSQAKPCSAALQCLEWGWWKGFVPGQCISYCTHFAISAFCRTGNMAWRTLASSKSARNNGKGLPWMLSGYYQKENSGLTLRQHLCRGRGTSSPLPLGNSCEPCWSGKAVPVEHHSSSVKQELKTCTNSVITNCWISLFLGWNNLKILLL